MDDPASFLAQCDALTGERSHLEILTDAFALLSADGRWCQGAHALRADGYAVRPNNGWAVAFSIEGALAHCSNQAGIVPPTLIRLMDQMVLDFLSIGTTAGIWEDRDVGWFNDTFDHASVVELLDYTCRRLA